MREVEAVDLRDVAKCDITSNEEQAERNKTQVRVPRPRLPRCKPNSLNVRLRTGAAQQLTHTCIQVQHHNRHTPAYRCITTIDTHTAKWNVL